MDLLAKARADLGRLDEMIRRAQETLERAQREREEIANFVRVYERYAKGDTPSAITAAGLPTKTDVVRATARELLMAAGRRLPIHEMHDQLAEKGVEVSGKQPRANLAGILSRDSEQFTYSKIAGGWWLVGQPEPGTSVAVIDAEDPDAITENEDAEASSDAEAPHGDADGASNHNPPQFRLETRTAA